MKFTVKFSIVLLLAGLASAQNIKIKGSAELLPITDRWANSYSKTHPGTQVMSLGGGTSAGIESVGNGSAEIATSERSLSDSEARALRGPIDVVFGTDALVFVVHPSNRVASLTLEQVRDIYAGRITNWSQVGGANLPIHPMAISANFGTTHLVRDKVMKGAAFGPNVHIASSEHDLLYSVWQDPAGISYTGMALSKEFKQLAISQAGGTPYKPSVENVQAGRYPLTHPVHMYLTDRASNAARDFAVWALSSEGQQHVAASGIYALTAAERERYRAHLNR